MNNTDNLQVTDIVRLTSGSSPLTIETIEDSMEQPGVKIAICRWFDGKEFREEEFNIDVLMKDEKKKDFNL
jgi:uncharacterized protein YodC (DUF2158 family)